MRKLLFFDIDGTLCMPGKAPSPRTVEAIAKARANGHKVFLSTGRNIVAIPKAVNDIGFDGYITNAGACAQVGDNILLDLPLPKELLTETMDLLQSNDICVAIQSDNDNYTDEAQNERVKATLDPASLGYLDAFINVLKLNDWAGHADSPVYKICFIAPSHRHWERVRSWMEGRYDITLFDNLFPSSALISGELNRKGTDKGRALNILCAHFGQTAEDAIAFGDSTNDSAMLIAAGTGYAMANAQEEVKAIADAICPHCNEDGVAKTLEALGLC